jgi:hypothetical protein
MAINFNINPYYDDFDENSGFHRILFRPGFAVQARELTQLQTQLQDQINKFGKHIFVNGSVVVGGGRTFESDLVSIKLDTNFGGATVNPANFNGLTIIGATSKTEAIVKQVFTLTTSDPITLIVKITSGGTFTAGETITAVSGLSTYSAAIQNSLPFNSAMIFSIDEGIFFVDGKFVFSSAQSVAVDKYSNTSSKNIGFTVKEEIITSDKDTQLLDGAQGSPNYAAPGADRYGITLTLISKNLGTVTDNFIEVARVVDGELVVNNTKTIYSEIGNELARRTFDESGDYTVKKWPIQILDHQATSPDDTKFTVALDPGKGYIKGYEYETINQEFLTLDRARDTDQADNLDVNVTYGNYVYVDTVSGYLFTNASASAYTTVNLNDSGPAVIGTAKVRFFQWDNGTIGTTSAVYRMYLFDIQMNANKIFGNVITITNTANSFSSTIDALSKVAGTGATFLTGSDSPGLVFPLSNSYIKTIRDSLNAVQTDYTIQRTFTGSVSAGVITIATDDGLERFVGTSGSLSDTIKDQNYHVVVGTTVYRMNAAAGRTITLSTPTVGVAHQATFNLNSGGLSGTARIIASVNVNTQTEKIKALSNYIIKIISSPNGTEGNIDTLAVSDVYDVSVYNTGTTNPTAVTINGSTGELTWGAVAHTDVTENYILDNGQRAEFYDHGGIILSGTAPSPSNYLLVVYRNFTHTGDGFFSVDSYSVPYEDIPQFTDPASGQVYELRDVIDFRPRRSDGGTSLIGGQVPDPDGTLNADYQYYLGRMDKIIATADREFTVKKGIPAIAPNVPSDLSNGMTLYIAVIPPYTSNIRDVDIKYIENKRYTMRDIGRLEKRIGNLEYYTQLSLLEKQAKDTSIPDSSNIEKFKNGFVVDPFTSQDIFVAGASAWAQRRWGWWNAWFNGTNTWTAAAQNYNANSIAQAANPDFNAAIDPINQELRSPFTVDFHYFDVGTLTNTERNGDLVTLEYTEKEIISQNVTTGWVNINPFNVIKFYGTIKLEPSVDQWVDVQYLPAINRVVDVQLPDAADRIVNVITNPGARGITRVLSSSSTVSTNVVGSSTQTLGTAVVDVQAVPFIRAKTVIGVGSLFKPKARLYPFVENTGVSAYVKPLTIVTIQNFTGTSLNATTGVYEQISFKTGSISGTQVATARTAIFSQASVADSTKRQVSVYAVSGTISVGQYAVGTVGSGNGIVTAVTTYSLADSIIPDEYGNIGFEFQLPANTFKTGERTIRLIDNAANDAVNQDSIGEAKYTATGQIQTRQENFLTTRTLQNQRVTTQRLQIYDPTAQSFFIETDAFPQGIHLSSVNVYFRSKSKTIPVTMEIREVVNGYPSSRATIPFAEAILKPEQVSTSSTGATATKFTFANPIHLVPGEYAIVLLANTQEYEVYVAEMGATILGGTARVDKQPYIGSLFKSQNASTWEPDQNKDLKFTINRAEFVTSGSVEFNVQDPDTLKEYHALFANATAIVPTGTSIEWYAKAYYGSATFDVDWAPININQDIEYASLRQLAAASGIGGTPSLRIKADLTTESDTVSPAIDATTLSIVAAVNTINNDSSGEANAATNGNALARYITTPINLASGFDASNLVVTVDINKPAATDVKVYYKALPSGSASPIGDQIWYEMDLETVVPSSTNSFDYKEHRFFPPNAFNQYGVPADDPVSPRFNTFQIKIVMLSSTVTRTPKLRDLRIIALDV